MKTMSDYSSLFLISQPPKGIHAQPRVEALAGWQITTGDKVPKALEKCVFQSELKGPGPKPVNFFNAHLG